MATDNSGTMKAAVIRSFGGPDVIQISDIPKPKAVFVHDVLVKVVASSVSAMDVHLRGGGIANYIVSFPWILGFDFSGIVEDVGSAVTHFKPGDEVFGMSRAEYANKPEGANAQFVVVKEKNIALKPHNISHEQAASLPTVALATMQAFEKHPLIPGIVTDRVWNTLPLTEIPLGKDQLVLVHGGSGGIGSFAIQYCKLHGAYVAATCSTDKVAFVKSLGADVVIDYTKENFDARLRDFDFVLDPIGGELEKRSLACLKPEGVLISFNPLNWRPGKLGPLVDLAIDYGHVLWQRNIIRMISKSPEYEPVWTHQNGDQMKELSKMLSDGKIKPQVDKVYPLEQISQAHAYLESGKVRGKVVLKHINN